jgi:nitroreductase
MLNKEADTKFSINELCKKRWSPRAFSDKTVEREKLQSIFEAARWSASGGNQQPWRFIVGIKGDETWEKVYGCLDDGNRVWAHLAPVLMITCGKVMTESGTRENGSYRYDTGQAVAHLSVEATNQGLHVHQMAGFYPDKAIEVFRIPEGFNPLTAVAIGYLGDPGLLDERNQKRELEPRTRKDFREFVFNGTFGNQLDIFK